MIQKYINLWFSLTVKTTQVAFASRSGVIFFTLGKVLRFIFFLLFLLLLLSETKSLAGYSYWQVILFFVVFNLVDTLTQFFLREVYRFRSYIVTGSFDYLLLKPVSPLLRALFGGSDILDLITLIPLIGFMFYVASNIPGITFFSVFAFLLLLCNAFIIAVAFHIAVLALGVITTEVDNAIWIFRDMTNLGRVPISIYREPVSWILTFIVPVAALITIPSQALMGLLSLQGLLVSFGFSIGLLVICSFFWNYALKRYTSASS